MKINPYLAFPKCRICNKMKDISLLKKSQLPAAGHDSGVLKPNIASNRNAISIHPNSVAHKR